MPRGKKRYSAPIEVDPSPLYAVKVNPDGTLDHSAAFDPQYKERCPECQEIFTIKEGHECPSSQSTENLT